MLGTQDIQTELRQTGLFLKNLLQKYEDSRANYPFNLLHRLAKRRQKLGRYSVYVILLQDGARGNRWRTNNGNGTMPCVYVGQTGKTVKERYRDHEHGHKSPEYIRLHAIGLLNHAHNRYNPLPDRETALAAESALAEALRQLGCTVFGGH